MTGYKLTTNGKLAIYLRSYGVGMKNFLYKQVSISANDVIYRKMMYTPSSVVGVFNRVETVLKAPREEL